LTEESPHHSTADQVPGQCPSVRAWRIRAALGATLIGGLGLGTIWVSWQSRIPISRSGVAVASPRIAATAKTGRHHQTWPETPYPNARAGVDYVGDAACARCHPEIARIYAQHPMGHSLRPIDEAIGGGEPPFRDRPTFEAGESSYSVENRGGRVDHIEVRRNVKGREIVRNEAEVRYVIGSGRRAISFLIERGDGYLFESPISWYAQERTWDISPGFERNNPHFERPIRPACLFCHANRTDAVAGTENHYRPPIFRGHAIGCERCHGPGAIHIRQPLALDGQPPAILNPARLEPTLREAVCQQCHLQGAVRLVRAGRSLDDFRPGLPLHEFVDVYFQAVKPAEKRFVGQVQQLYGSRCFLASRVRWDASPVMTLTRFRSRS
jgi:hypothetical protein